jgi:hypothetical protein
MDRRPHAFAPLALAVAAALSLVACNGDDDDADDTLAPIPTSAVVETAVPAATAAPTTDAPTTTAAPTTPVTEPASTEPPPTEPPPTEPPPTEPPPTAPPAPSTTVAPATLTLARDGLGVVPFGAEAEAAVAALTGALGAPTEDTGWVDPLTISSCAGTELRRVSWGTLTMLLGDPAATGTGLRQFFAYSYGNVADVEAQPAGLVTPEGIGLGAPVADLRAAYPGVVVNPGEEGLIEPSFFVDDHLRGIVTGDADTDSVTVIFGGPFCG